MAMATLFTTASEIVFSINHNTGAISSMRISGDPTGMEWLLKTDGRQYAWVNDIYGWGLGYFYIDGNRHYWRTPQSLSADGMKAEYKAGGITINVERAATADGFTEKYTFTNTGNASVRLTDIGIFTPFNDNYPKSATCMSGRCNAHIWPGGNAAYVQAVRMCGTGDGIALMATQGSIDNYDIWERDRKKAYSNFRGVISLSPADTTLKPGKSTGVAWRVFRHNGTNDFFAKMIGYGGAVASSDRYVYQVGETATINIKTSEGTSTKKVKINKPGEMNACLEYGKGQHTYATLLGVSSTESIIGKRVNFIIDHQQMNDRNDPRYGALMVYDNETDKIYLNDGTRKSDDTDEGRERVGMGVLLAKWYKLHPDKKILDAAIRYADFIKRELQYPDYTTYSAVNKKGRHRGYNYPWIADFYFHMYEITGNKQYAADGYGTMRAFFRNFNYGFYAIDIPLTRSLDVLGKAGMAAERDTLLADYHKTGDKFAANGLNFPGHEVNYEQSIVAPAVQFLSELYLATGDDKYLTSAKMMMPALEAFTGRQPSHHFNEIAIRHWDGYWFGKRQLFGDTFPHYWSALNGSAYHYFGKCVKDSSWQERARNVVRNNLSLFSENGRASCAYLSPRMVNGEKAQYYDAYANDQDWALVFYLLVNHNI